MSEEVRRIRTGFGVLTESASPAPSFDEIVRDPRARSSWRPFYVLAVAGLAALVFVSTVVFDSGVRLAYASDPGLDLTYTVNSENTVGGETFTAGPATVGYQIRDAGDGLIDVQISYVPLDGCGTECPPGVTFTQTITEEGEIVRFDGDEGLEFPAFVIPVPIPQAGIVAGFPRFLGPPLPDGRLALGDTWETDERGVTGQHQLVEETESNGREVVTIESTYAYIHPLPDLGEYTASTTVWFDPADGIVVQAQITRNNSNNQGIERTIQMDFKLDR